MACVKSVSCNEPSDTSARRPFSPAAGSVTAAPAATYQAQAASRSATLTARFAMPVTVIPGAYGVSRKGRGHPMLAHRCGAHRRGLSITVTQVVAESRRAGGMGMSLMTVGRNAVLIEQL